MNISLVLKVAGVGLIVSVAHQILQKSGRDEQATLLSIGGIILVMLLILSEMKNLFNVISTIFGI